MPKPKGFDDITQQRYEEMLEEYEQEKYEREVSREERRNKSRGKSADKSRDRSRSKKRPQTAHYPLKSQFDEKHESRSKPKKKRANRPKVDKDHTDEYINIIRKYEDVLKDKVKEGKAKKTKPKEKFSLKSKDSASQKSLKDPYAKYISFYPSKSDSKGMLDEKFGKE